MIRDLGLAFVLLMAGCATGEGVDESGGVAGSGDGGVAGLSSGNGGFPGTGGSSKGGSGGTSAAGGTGGGATGGTSSGGSGGSGATGGSGTGGSGTGGSGTGGSGTGGSGTCGTPNTCAAALDLGSVSGDSGSDSVQRTGQGTTFLRLRVTEDNSSPLGQSLKLTASLTVPSLADYDLYAYVNTNTDTSPCGMSPAQKSESGTGQSEQVKLSWGEGVIANNLDDGRYVVIEVRYKSGACASSDLWHLTAAGNK